MLAHGDAGAVGAEDDGDLIGDQLLGSGDGLVGRGLVVLNVELDLVFFAVNGDGRLDGVGVLDAQNLLLVEVCSLTKTSVIGALSVSDCLRRLFHEKPTAVFRRGRFAVL